MKRVNSLFLSSPKHGCGSETHGGQRCGFGYGLDLKVVGHDRSVVALNAINSNLFDSDR